ncbi:hypothetical protein BH93_21220 [Rhodococcoides fascians A25f]|uniref:hypothetical protein n=1 Tax=Rhodococcoides fascians TaxID=1828 RepID=UPI000561186F|nr:hypothetical protein [Rhodococcus fascians]QII07556.1 hypothetical protein BH93_21220 [Rhodococcus fascians A25f]
MTTPGSNIFSRYQGARTKAFLENDADLVHRLPALRPRKRRRAFVVTMLVLLAMASVFALLDPVLDWAIALWAIFYIAFSFGAIALGIVSDRRAEAPDGALDEFEIQRRNEVRSTGLRVTQWLGTVAAGYLFIGSVFVSTNLGISGGALILIALLAGNTTPAMLLAWTTPDPDPEDG